MTTVSIKLPDDQLKHLRFLSHYLSLERDSDLTLSDIIREAITNTYPLPSKDATVGCQTDES
jgi:hypothetical protein